MTSKPCFRGSCERTFELAFRRADSLFACRKSLIANSVPNLPFVCQANLKTSKIIAQKISFAEKICKFFQARAQNKTKKVPQITENTGWGGGILCFCEIFLGLCLGLGDFFGFCGGFDFCGDLSSS